MPVIEGGRVVERYLGPSDSIIQQQVRKLAEGFEEFIKLALRTGRIHFSKGMSLNLNNFKFEYDQSEMGGGSVDILYVIVDTLLVDDTSSIVADWFFYFVSALENSNSKIHSKSAGYYDHLDEKQIKSVRISLRAIKGMAIENEKLRISTFGTFDSSFFNESHNKPPKVTYKEKESVVSELANDDVDKELDDDSGSTKENSERTEDLHPETDFIFDTIKAPPVYSPEIFTEEAEINNAHIKKIDVDSLSITLQKNTGGFPVTVMFEDSSDYNIFIDEYPEAPKRDCLSFDLHFLKRSDKKNIILSIEKAVVDNPYLKLLADD